ncbi:PHP domain-containing protein [Nocardioides sp.]|uniref:PHP domain-containing protein n=1 Tax=Nocardioides sp. TaxID=35761 RepID=UPI003563F4E8
MRIDLHAHSRVSDGTQSPSELVRAAKAAGLDVLGLTDHDTTLGWAQAQATAMEVGLTLVRGVEVSTRHLGRSVHLLAYLPDPTFEPLLEQFDRILRGRGSRVPAIVERLQGHGIDISVADVQRAARGTAATGRPHVADAMVSLGHVKDRTEAFRRFLNPGMPGYVDRYAASLVEVLRIVASAGGVSVIAHPWGRHGSVAMPESSLAELAGLGLAGIEVDHQDHSPADRETLRAIAHNLDLLVTGSSDHHGAGKIDHELGCNTTDPDEYHRLLALASAAAARSGRRTPEVTGAMSP